MNMIHITCIINEIIKFDYYDKFIGSICHYYDQSKDLILRAYAGLNHFDLFFMSFHWHRLAKQKNPSSHTQISQQNTKTLIYPTTIKTLRIGKNGEREDLTMIHVIDKLCPKICHVHPIAPTKLTNETPLATYTQCASRGLEIINHFLPSYPLHPIELWLRNLVTIRILSDHHHPPNHILLLLL